MAMTVKDELLTLAEQLPDDATWDDVLKRLEMGRGVLEGQMAANRGEFTADADVRRLFAKYGVLCLPETSY